MAMRMELVAGGIMGPIMEGTEQTTVVTGQTMVAMEQMTGGVG